MLPSHMPDLLAQATKFLRAGRPADAIPPLREAARLAPFNATIQHDLGLACLDADFLPEAVAALQSATAANPRYTDAWFRLGVALERLGDAGGAVAAYDKATELLPSHTEAWFRAGALVFTLGHVEEAAGCFRRAAASGPKTSFGRLGAARALLAENRDSEAEKVLRQALALDKHNPVALDLLGNLLADSGRFEEARACFARAIDQAPRMAGCYYDLVRCRKITPEEAELLPRMEAALATPGLDDVPRMRVHLAMGKAADDLGDYALAMRHFDAAYELRAKTSPFDIKNFQAETDKIIARFTPDLISQASTRDSPDATPVLIIGLPRSGTTLMEQIISSHPGVSAGGELNFWNDRGAKSLQAGPAGLEPAFLQQAANDYLCTLRAIGPKAIRVTDKMPFNFLWAGLIHLALPNATIIHCRRADIDTALSIHQTLFNPNVAFPTGGSELIDYIRCARRLTDHWKSVLPQNRFIEINYDNLTHSPEKVIRRVIAACGLPWDESCLSPEKNPRVVKTPSKWQARQPINRNAVERWRRYGNNLGMLVNLTVD